MPWALPAQKCCGRPLRRPAVRLWVIVDQAIVRSGLEGVPIRARSREGIVWFDVDNRRADALTAPFAYA